MKPIRLPRLTTPIGWVNDWIDQVCSAIDASRNISTVGPLSAIVTPNGTQFKLGLPETFWIQLTGAADATLGGYPWSEVIQQPALYTKNRGTGYTSTPTVVFTGDGTLPTATIGFNANGTLKDPVVTAPGSNNTTLSASVTGGGGTGGTLGLQLNEGACEGIAWVATGRTGGTGDFAYEVRNNRALSATSATYLATRNPDTGQLLFFSRSTIEAQTFTKVTYPTTAGSYYAMHPVTIGGLETEGGAGSVSVNTSVTFYARNLGGTVPPSGTTVKVSFTGSRFAFRYD